MRNPAHYALAFDLGAESGRAILGAFDGNRLSLNDVHRFPNLSVRLPDGLHWNLLGLWYEILNGLNQAYKSKGEQIRSVGLDTWGVDYVLLDKQRNLIGQPWHYRDSRTDGMIDAAARIVPKEVIYQNTGIQFLQLNTLYQLFSMVQAQSPALEIADVFLTMPDLLHYWLSGRIANEYTIATTTQCFDTGKGAWATGLLESLDIPTHLFQEVIPPGTVLGSVNPRWLEGTNHSAMQVIVPACHDTGSAVVAVPTESDNYAWISSGTWSIMGTERRTPIINEQSMQYQMTNEGGYPDRIRFCKNIMGLWPLQESRRTWRRQGDDLDYGTLTEMARTAPALRTIINVDDHGFLEPGDMPARIRQYCTDHHLAAPEDKPAIVRCILESVALKYRSTLDALEAFQGAPIAHVHIVGGGTQNELLSQYAADAMNRPVITGPVEATAIGNLLVQMISSGVIKDLAEARQVVRNSFELKTFLPSANRDHWEDAYLRMKALTDQAA